MFGGGTGPGTAGTVPGTTPSGIGSIFRGGGIDGVGNFGYAGDIGSRLLGGAGKIAGGIGGLLGGGGSGGIGGLLAAGVPAYMLGKMAYDEAKADKGVALTPLTTMGPTGRYNIEAEIARRMGTEAPNPVEFGLLPQGTLPQLSGGQPMAVQQPMPPEGNDIYMPTYTPTARPFRDQQQFLLNDELLQMEMQEPMQMDQRPLMADVAAPMPMAGNYRQGGSVYPMSYAGGGVVYPMSYANGGDVSAEDFQRMNGQINGEGTETSDEIPAMLSDGEFVMTGAAVRGAGGFEMDNKGGILTLTPSGTPDRERGTNVMNEMMGLFGSYANAAT